MHRVIIGKHEINPLPGIKNILPIEAKATHKQIAGTPFLKKTIIFCIWLTFLEMRYIIRVGILYKQRNVIIVGTLVIADLAANRAFVRDYVALLRMRRNPDWVHHAFAFTLSVAGININVKRG